eukprot:2499399-Amphidinium_carterae.1
MAVLTECAIFCTFRNHLSGALPPEMRPMSALTHLFVFENHLQGSLPEEGPVSYTHLTLPTILLV